MKNCTSWVNSSPKFTAWQIARPFIRAAARAHSIDSTISSPSPDTINRCLPKIELEPVKDNVNRHFAQLHQRYLPRKKGKVWLAIDFHNESYYGKKLWKLKKQYILIGPKKGPVISYTTLSILRLGEYTIPFTVANSLTYKGR